MVINQKSHVPRILVAGLLILFILVLPAAGDDKQLEDLKARLDKLEKENEKLQKQLEEKKDKEGKDTKDKDKEDKEKKEKEKLTKAIDSYMKDKEKKKKEEDEKKAREKEAEGFELGKQLDCKARFTNYELWFETEDKAFRFRVGGRTQIDAVWVHAPVKVMAPLAVAGIGEYDDGVNFRRARLQMEGTFWEVLDFYCQYDFMNVTRIVPSGDVVRVADAQGRRSLNNLAGTLADRANVINTPVPTDLWIQWKDLPLIGKIRFGNQKPWIGFEHLTSSRYLDYMERSMAFDSFLENGNNGFTVGLSTFNTYLDDLLFFGAGMYKPNFRDIFGWNVGDGEYLYAARVAATPIYKEHGRYLLHLGVGFQHSTADDGVFRYRSRPELRNSNAILHNIFAIIQMQGHDQNLLVPELAISYGPFNLAAEYYGAWTNQRRGDAFLIVGNQTTGLPAGSRGALFYQGGYITVGYFLTGESRGYDKKSKAWGRQLVDENAFFVDGEEGLCCGKGAWEILARYGWVDLDSKDVNGGVVHDWTLGLNWFLNANAKLQFNYSVAYRDATEYANGRVAPNGNGSRDGIIQGFGTRFAFDF